MKGFSIDPYASLAPMGNHPAPPASAPVSRVRTFVDATELVPTPVHVHADEAELLRAFGYDPAAFELMGATRSMRNGVLATGNVRVRPRPAPAVDIAAEVEQLGKQIKNWRPARGSKPSSGENTYAQGINDWQIGKVQGEAGTGQTTCRILAGLELAHQRSIRLVPVIGKFGLAVLPGMGDMSEGISSQGGKLQGQAASDLGYTEQIRLGAQLLLAHIKTFASTIERVFVPAVNGNHDDPTRQVSIDPIDGAAILATSMAQMAVMENPDLKDRVSFAYPASGENTLVVEAGGKRLALAHGDQISGGNFEGWLAKQALGQTDFASADLFLTAHYHNYKVHSLGNGRFWVQFPTTDPGSNFYRNRAGATDSPGVGVLAWGPNVSPMEYTGFIPLDHIKADQ